MKLTQEQLAKAKAAKSVEELLTLAKENGMELTEEEAVKYFTEWHREGEIADEELDNVSGGCGDDEPDVPPHTYAVGAKVNSVDRVTDPCPVCGAALRNCIGGFCCTNDPKFILSYMPGGLGHASYYYVSSNDNS